MVVAQAVSLLLWDVLLLGASLATSLLSAGGWASAKAACSGGLEGAGCSRAPGALLASRCHVSLFVELLVFAALLVGLVCAPLLQALFAPAAVAGANTGSSAAAHAGSRAAQRASRKAEKRQGRGRGLNLKIVGLLAAVVGCAAAAAAFPAAWALGFALGSWRRAALVGYWAGLLLAALPLMDWVSRRRRVPTIIVRKVCGLRAPVCSAGCSDVPEK
jgi:hypothetical protein